MQAWLTPTMSGSIKLKQSKFKSVREIAKEAEQKNTFLEKEDKDELSENDLQKMADDYYRGNTDAYRR